MDEILIEADEGTRRLEKEDVCVGIVGIVWERLITSSYNVSKFAIQLPGQRHGSLTYATVPRNTHLHAF